MLDARSGGRARAPFLRASLAVHAVGGVAWVVAPAQWPWILGAIVADQLVLVAGSLIPRSTLVGPNLRRVPAAEVAGRGVVMTFDDGPDPEVTPRVLDLLDASGATASFFCVGARAEKHPALIEEIARRGHRIENHSWRHAWSFCFEGPATIRRELGHTQQLLTALAGAAPRYFRAPAGLRNPWLDSVLSPLGLELVSWTRRGFDTIATDPATVVRRLTHDVAVGDILLLHDRGTLVLEALPALLDGLAARGLDAVKLPLPAAGR